MAFHKLLVEDFLDDSFSLFGIHCNIEDYRLVYLLNKHLDLKLERKPNDLDFEYVTASYALFEWIDDKQAITWNLVSNICKREENSLVSSGSLFDNQNKIIKTYNLIPEYANVNYMLKVDNDGTEINEKLLLDKLQEIPQIITAYTIDIMQLKSKDNLIFK